MFCCHSFRLLELRQHWGECPCLLILQIDCIMRFIGFVALPDKSLFIVERFGFIIKQISGKYPQTE